MADEKPDPDFVYNADDWECTYSWSDRYEMVEDIEVGFGDVFEASTLLRGPTKYLAVVVLTRDEAGDPDETEVTFFDTKEEAEAAVAAQRRPAA